MLKRAMRFVPMLLLVLSRLLASEAWAQEEDIFFEKKPASRKQAIGLSVLFPGLGQAASGHRMKGTALFVSEILTLTVAIHAHEVHGTKLSQFNQMKEEYEQIRYGGSYAEAEAKWKDMLGARDDMDRLQRLRLGFLCASAGIYLYNVTDMLLLNRYGGRQGAMAKAGVGVQVCLQADRGTPSVVVAKSW